MKTVFRNLLTLGILWGAAVIAVAAIKGNIFEADHQEKMAQTDKKADEADVIMSSINSEIHEALSIKCLIKAKALVSTFKQIMATMKDDKIMMMTKEMRR